MKWYVDISGLVYCSVALSGIQRVEYNLCRHLSQSGLNIEFIFYNLNKGGFWRVSQSLVERLVKRFEQGGDVVHQTARLRRQISQRSRQSLEATKEDLVIIPSGVWFAKNYIDDLGYLTQQTRVVHLVHDAIALRAPAIASVDHVQICVNYLQRILPKCYRIAPNSKDTAQAIPAFFRQWGVKQKPALISWPFGADLAQVKPVRPVAIKHRNFILQVARLTIGKNIALLIQTYRLAQERNIDLPHLYIAGQKEGYFSDSINYLLDHDVYLRKKITRLGSQDTAQLAWLYQNAQLTVFPSFYESYGLPVAESLLAGRVSLVAKAGGLPEVGGRLADYFSPYSSDQLLDLLVKYQDKDIRQKREQQIQTNYKPVTWQQATNTLATNLKKLG